MPNCIKCKRPFVVTVGEQTTCLDCMIKPHRIFPKDPLPPHLVEALEIADEIEGDETVLDEKEFAEISKPAGGGEFVLLKKRVCHKCGHEYQPSGQRQLNCDTCRGKDPALEPKIVPEDIDKDTVMRKLKIATGTQSELDVLCEALSKCPSLEAIQAVFGKFLIEISRLNIE